MSTPDRREQLSELLPWYENDTLRGAERDAVHALLGSDLEANRQRRELRALRSALSDEPILAPNMALNLHRLHAHLDAPRVMTVPRRLFVLAALVILALSVATFIAGARWGSYRTLSTPSGDTAPPGAQLLRVDVATGIDAATLVQIAGDAQVRVLHGPSQYGVATLIVPSSHAAQIMKRLSDDPRLRFVAAVPSG